MGDVPYRTIFSPIGGRRFFMTMGCAVICTFLLWFGKIDQSIFRDIILGTVAVFIAGNVTQKVMESKYDDPTPRA